MVSVMIVSASYRTDIPAFYSDWFMRRLAAGQAWVANPYRGKPYVVSLAPGDVDGFVFWTRNVGPLQGRLREIAAIAPFVVQFTVTGYPRALEPGVIDTETAVAQIRALSEMFGPRAVVWRYDPIVETSLTPPAWHCKNFARLAAMLEGYVDEVTISFAQIYTKTARNLNLAAREHGFAWRDPEDEEKRSLAGELAEIAISHDMRLTVCSQPGFLGEGQPPGVPVRRIPRRRRLRFLPPGLCLLLCSVQPGQGQTIPGRARSRGWDFGITGLIQAQSPPVSLFSSTFFSAFGPPLETPTMAARNSRSCRR
jgi:hypothetical protein